MKNHLFLNALHLPNLNIQKLNMYSRKTKNVQLPCKDVSAKMYAKFLPKKNLLWLNN